jgi:hypothetical protein
MSFIDTLKSFIVTTEADVVAIIAKIKTAEEVVVTDINNALHWIASNAPTIVSDIQSVIGVAETVGVASNPQVAAAITAANLAVAALNSFAAASNAGQTSTQAVLQGYVAVKQAQAAAASAAAAAVATPTKTTATVITTVTPAITP